MLKSFENLRYNPLPVRVIPHLPHNNQLSEIGSTVLLQTR